jgi:hypothetical protein
MAASASSFMRRHRTAAIAIATEHAPGKPEDHGMASQLPARTPGISASLPAATPFDLGAFTDAPERWVGVSLAGGWHPGGPDTCRLHPVNSRS